MIDRNAIDDILAQNRYLVLGTADRSGQPWVTPVFFATLDPKHLCWASSPDSRHSRNIADRPKIGITVFDSTVEVGRAEAAYFDAVAAPATADDTDTALRALNSRLPAGKLLSADDLQPHGPMVIYWAQLQRHYALVRGGNREHGNMTDMTLEVWHEGSSS